jgi:hypothetical protein
MYELMKNEELWRERRRDSLRRVSGVRRVVDSGSGLGARVRGWLRRGVAILGYRDPESSRVPLEAVQRPGRCGAGGGRDRGGIAWTARRR